MTHMSGNESYYDSSEESWGPVSATPSKQMGTDGIICSKACIKISKMHPAVLKHKLPKNSPKIKSNQSNKTRRIRGWPNTLNCRLPYYRKTIGTILVRFRLWAIIYGP